MSLEPGATDINTDIATGFADPVHGSQRTFRRVLDAFAHPGRIVALDDAPEPPGTLNRASAGLLLTLADQDTPLWLAPEYETPAVCAFVKFHTGAPVMVARAEAAFALLSLGDAPLFEGFAVGSDDYPDRSATLVIEVPVLGAGAARTWRGPGIDGTARVAVAGLDAAFWQGWAANGALAPCGVDVVFTAGSQLLALPRGIVVDD
ncbi:MAG: phosphonate C-P lyase system protein PhnH [Reyranella sp.]|nr:phosphonate C-P lyase system protein PhnH [Reyranella sp.]